VSKDVRVRVPPLALASEQALLSTNRTSGTGWTVCRSVSWYFWVELEPGPDGQRRQKSRCGFKTRREAERAFAELRDAVRLGTYGEPSSEPKTAKGRRSLALDPATIRALTDIERLSARNAS
jgi:hypothetical protein